MTQHLFVYGTLKQAWWRQKTALGAASEIIEQLQQQGQYLGEARLRGALYHLGRYPGLVLNPMGLWSHRCRLSGVSGSEWFYVELWHIEEELWPSLDRYEGADRPPYEYHRLRVSAVMEPGDEPAEAWAYVLNTSRWQGEVPEWIASGRFEG
jgi:gamma-glutamylcyclotransferase (GGCT)/AIG2-like uncharacterized protein YtfP